MTSQVSKDSITPLQQMIASCSGAILTSLFVTPLDVIKIRLQAQRSPFPKGKCFVYCNGLMDHICVCVNENGKAWYKPRGHFNGTLDAFIKIVRMEGIKSLWSGLPPTLVMAVPATVMYFTCYDQLCAALRIRMGDQADKAPPLAGGIARVGSATLISPLELIRTKLQSERQSYRQLSAVIRSAVHTEGWLALWRGLGPTLLRDVPFSAMYWYNYEKGKDLLCRYKSSEPTVTITFIAGAVSGSIASIVTLPFDVVKTRRQVELGELQARNLSVQASSSTYNVMKRIVGENGIKGLFAGLEGCITCILKLSAAFLGCTRRIFHFGTGFYDVGAVTCSLGFGTQFISFMPRLIKVAPACAIMISTYEFGKAFFHKQNQERKRRLIALQTSNS